MDCSEVIVIHCWREYLRNICIKYKNNDVLYSACATIFVQKEVSLREFYELFILSLSLFF